MDIQQKLSVPIGIIPVTDFKIKMKPGTWVKEYCRTKGMFSFWHHGIVSEVDKRTQYPTKIIHFCIPEQNQDLTTERVICETSVAYFLEDAEDPQVVDQEPKFSYREIVERAQQYIGKGEYDLKSKNCEHFASWCYLGAAYSEQVLFNGIAAIVIIASIAIAGVVACANQQWI